jgi:hypothetical protein
MFVPCSLIVTWPLPPNAKVSDRGEPPLMFDLSLRESAGSGSLHRLVGLGHLEQQIPPPRQKIEASKRDLVGGRRVVDS